MMQTVREREDIDYWHLTGVSTFGTG